MEAEVKTEEVVQDILHVGAWVTWGTGVFALPIASFNEKEALLVGTSYMVSDWCPWNDNECTRVEIEELRIVYAAGDAPHEEIVETGIEAIDFSEEPANVDDKVHRPSHYTDYEIEPIQFIMRNDPKGFYVRGNVCKYAYRAGKKQYDGLTLVESEIRDWDKIRRYSEMRINQLKGEEVL